MPSWRSSSPGEARGRDEVGHKKPEVQQQPVPSIAEIEPGGGLDLVQRRSDEAGYVNGVCLPVDGGLSARSG
jgi:hypothetical protein